MTVTSGKDLLLVLLLAQGRTGQTEPIKGITRLEKLAFLTKEYPALRPIFERLNYRGDHYGPFSDRVQDDMEALRTLGLVETGEIAVGDEPLADELLTDTSTLLYTPSRTIIQYSLTSLGRNVAERLAQTATSEQIAAVQEIKRKFNSIPLDQLLSYVYRNSERQYTERSRIRDRYIH